MAGAGREVRVVQVVGLDAGLDEGAHQLGQNLGIVVDAAAAAPIWLTMTMPASTSRAQARASRRRQLARMVGVQRHIGRLAADAFSAAISAASTRSGSTTGTRVWKRTILTCSMRGQPLA